MPYIQRELQPQITRETPPKAVVIFGARQIGKTTLLTELSQHEKSVRWFNGERASEILCPWDNRSPPNGCIQ